MVTKTLSGKLALLKYQEQNCNHGSWQNNKQCIVELEKSKCLVIRGKSKPMGENKYRIYQSKQNIKYELIKWLEINENSVSNIITSSNILVSASIFHEKEFEIRKFYTDGFLKTIDDQKKMAVG